MRHPNNWSETRRAMPNLTIDLSDLPSIVNEAYHPLFHDHKRYLVLVGGAGSGKSVSIAQKHLWRMATEPGHKFAVMRKVAATHRHSTWANFLDILGTWGWMGHVHVNKTDMTITFKPTGSQLIFLGLDNREKLKSITGITGFWLEEATEMAPEDLEQVNLRLRGFTKHYKQIVMTFNPISAQHWLKARFFDTDQHGRTTTMRSTYRDNKYLDKEYCLELEALKERDPMLWRIYAEGRWGVLKGLIYPGWGSAPWPEHTDDDWYGLDFGFNNPTSLTHIGVKDLKDVWLDETIYQSGLTTADLMELMAARGVSKKAKIYADGAEPDRIKEMQRAGWNVWAAKKGKGSVQAGISFVNSLNIRVTPRSGNISKEQHTYKWGEDKEGNLLDEPVKFMDHAMDGSRYGLTSHLQRDKPEAKSGVFGGLGVFGGG